MSRGLILGLLALATLLAPHFLSASILCPPDVTIACNMPYTDTNMTGHATVYGAGYNSARFYDDLDGLGSCSVGFIIRTWYADKNYNHQHDPTEVYCTQRITITDIDQPVTVDFPADITVDCPDDIPTTKPTIFGGICDLIATNTKDEIFTIVNDACLKVRRTFTVINHCDYHPSDPNWDGSGIYVGRQWIKVVQKAAPRLQVEGDFEFGVGSNCTASDIAMFNVGVEFGDCPSDNLKYEFYIDLDWDGELETRYSHLLSGDRYLAPKASGDSIRVDLVEELPRGSYKYKWTVSDGCGNTRSRGGTIRIVDNKPPTPYCLTAVQATVSGHDMPLRVSTSVFDRGAFDNCTPSDHIRISFSEDITDTVRMVDCDSRGIQFYRLYVTDEAGNSDYCNVFLLAFDNGNCGPMFSALGAVALPDGSPVPDIDFAVMDPQSAVLGTATSTIDGQFAIDGLELHADRSVMVYDNDYALESTVTLADYIILYRHVLGLEPLADPLKSRAGDINKDNRLTGADLRTMADHILGYPIDSDLGELQVVPQDLMENGQLTSDQYLFTDYDGSFDYSAYVIGDLDDSAGPTIAGVDNGKRQVYAQVYVTPQGDYQIVLPDDLDLSALLIKNGRGPIDAELGGQTLFSGSNADGSYLAMGIDDGPADNSLRVSAATDFTRLEMQLVDEQGASIDVEWSMTVDADDVASEDIDLRCFPNPASNRLHLGDNVEELRLIDLSGREVLHVRGQSSVAIDHLKAGIYMAYLRSIAGTTTVDHVMIVR